MCLGDLYSPRGDLCGDKKRRLRPCHFILWVPARFLMAGTESVPLLKKRAKSVGGGASAVVRKTTPPLEDVNVDQILHLVDGMSQSTPAIQEEDFPRFFSASDAFKKSKAPFVKAILERLKIKELNPDEFIRAYVPDRDSHVTVVDGGPFFGSLMVSENHGFSRKATVKAKAQGNLLLRENTVDSYMRHAIKAFRKLVQGSSRVVLVLDEARELSPVYTVHKRLERKSRSSNGIVARKRTDTFCTEMVGEDMVGDEGGTAAFFGDTHFDPRVSRAYPGDTASRPDLVGALPYAARATDLRTALATTDGTALLPGPYGAIWASRHKGRPELVAAVIARLFDAVKKGQAGDCVSLRVVGAHAIPIYEACSALQRSIDADAGAYLEPEDEHDDERVAAASPHGTWLPPTFTGRHLIAFRGYDKDTARTAFPFLDATVAPGAPDVHFGAYFASIESQGLEEYGESDHGVFSCAHACALGRILWPLCQATDPADWRRFVVPRTVVVHSSDTDFFYLSLLWWCWSQTHAAEGYAPPPPVFWARMPKRVRGQKEDPPAKIIRVDAMARAIAGALGSVSAPLAEQAHVVLDQHLLPWASPQWRGFRKHVMFQRASSSARDRVLSTVMVTLIGGFNDYMGGVPGVGAARFLSVLFDTGAVRTPFVTATFIPSGTPGEAPRVRASFAVCGDCSTPESVKQGRGRAADVLYWATLCAKMRKPPKPKAGTPDEHAATVLPRARAEFWAMHMEALAQDDKLADKDFLTELSAVPKRALGSDAHAYAQTQLPGELPLGACIALKRANIARPAAALAARVCGLGPHFYAPGVGPPAVGTLSGVTRSEAARALEEHYSLSSTKRPPVFPPPSGEADLRASLALAIINLPFALWRGEASTAFSDLASHYRSNGTFVFSKEDA